MLEMMPRNHYAAIAADPPWQFATRSDKGKGRSAERHYSCMSREDIAALPVADLAADDAVLFLWVTDPNLEEGLALMKAWGFCYKTVALTWAKTNADGTFFTGMGYWTRANPEMCLLGTRGRPRRIRKDVRQLLVSPRREHSRKPDGAYKRIQDLVPGPYIELFARARRPGWDAWGLEVGKFAAAAA